MKSLMNLTNALASFMEANWLPYEDSLGSINWSITNGTIDKEKLKSEYLSVISENAFDWRDLATKSQLLISPEDYSNEDIKNYVKFLLQDYLFPEQVISSEEVETLNIAVEDFLKKHTSNDGWISAYDVFEELKKQEQFKNLEYYNLWKIPFHKLSIERRPIENKGREIGYLKFCSPQ